MTTNVKKRVSSLLSKIKYFFELRKNGKLVWPYVAWFVFCIIGSLIFRDKFPSVVALIIATAFLVAASLLVFVAGFVVVKSLAVVGAELSLLIFLAQSFCAVSNRAPNNDEALKSIFTLGLTYIAFNFFWSLKKHLGDKYFVKKKGEKWGEIIVVCGLLLLFAGMFVYQLYLVLQPIVSNICVFKKA